MTGGPINPDREQQQADNRASWRQSHFGPPSEGPTDKEAESEDQEGAGRNREGEPTAGDGSERDPAE